MQSLPFATPQDVHRLESQMQQIQQTLNKMLPEKLDGLTFNSEQVCQILDCSLRTLQSYRETGRLAFSQIGNKIWYTPRDVDAFLTRHRNPAKAEIATNKKAAESL